MTTRIYKNEFHKSYIEYLKKNYKVEEETEKVLTLDEISEEDEEMFHSAMFKSYDELCVLFPETFTKSEAEFKKFKESVKDGIRAIFDEQLKLIQTPAWDNVDFTHPEDRNIWEEYEAISAAIKVLRSLVTR